MPEFADRVLMRLSDPADLVALLTPARLEVAVHAVYDLPHARIDRIDSATVENIQLEQPVFPVQHQTGTWTAAVPEYYRSDIALDSTRAAEPIWVDILVRLVVELVAEVDEAGVQSVLTRGIDDFTSLDDFRSRFRFINLDDFMRRHSLKTFQELRDAYEYLLAEIRLRTPPAFDPTDPNNRHSLAVTLAIVTRESLDLVDALRTAKALRRVSKDVVSTGRSPAFAEASAPYAPAVVFPQAVLGAGTPTAAEIEALYAREGVLSIFVDAA